MTHFLTQEAFKWFSIQVTHLMESGTKKRSESTSNARNSVNAKIIPFFFFFPLMHLKSIVKQPQFLTCVDVVPIETGSLGGTYRGTNESGLVTSQSWNVICYLLLCSSWCQREGHCHFREHLIGQKYVVQDESYICLTCFPRREYNVHLVIDSFESYKHYDRIMFFAVPRANYINMILPKADTPTKYQLSLCLFTEFARKPGHVISFHMAATIIG